LIRDEKWAYIQYKENASKGIELFDMEKDPKQYHNLAKKPEYAPIVKQYQAKFCKSCQAPQTSTQARFVKFVRFVVQKLNYHPKFIQHSLFNILNSSVAPPLRGRDSYLTA
jgi:hypothetical protein